MSFATTNKRLRQKPLPYRAFCWLAYCWCVWGPSGMIWWKLLPYAGEYADFGGDDNG